MTIDSLDALAARGARALEIRNFQSAFRYADRLCRTAEPTDALFLLLRAQALHGCREFAKAARDLASALDIDPANIAVANAILRFGPMKMKDEAAGIILSSSRADNASVRAALSHLLASEGSLAANIRLINDTLRGWVAWRGGLLLQLRYSDSATAFDFSRDTRHRFAADDFALADISIEVRGRLLPCFEWVLDGAPITSEAVFMRQIEPFGVAPSTSIAPSVRRGANADAGCTIIVPIYDDLESTIRCLASISDNVAQSSAFSVVLVLDCPHNAKLCDAVRALAEAHRFKILFNEVNLGFTGSVNKALADADMERDVLLLNSDVVLPPGCLMRLKQAAHSAPHIGTVTPLSNNGEITNFPGPHASTPLESDETVELIDKVASEVNENIVVTIPNGVGFCLYVVRACLDAIGNRLDASYGRGYFEDVDLCFRARRAGFTNVCATNVYVGHHGSRSFKNDKKALVARNRRVLLAKFPDFLRENLAFVKGDPLQASRRRIEMRLPAIQRQHRLVVTSERMAHAAQQIIRHLQKAGAHVLALTPVPTAKRGLMLLQNVDGGVPQSLTFDVSTDGGCRELVETLCRFAVTDVDVFSDTELPPALVNWLASTEITTRVLVDQAPFSVNVAPRLGTCELDRGTGECRSCLFAYKAPDKKEHFGRGKLLETVATRDTACILPLNGMAAALFEIADFKVGPETAIARQDAGHRHKRGEALAVWMPSRDRDASLFIRLLASIANRQKIGVARIVIMGEDDPSLLSFPEVYSVGKVAPADLRLIFKMYDIGRVLSPYRWGGLHVIEQNRRGRPMAYFDWSFGKVLRHDEDRLLDPRKCNVHASQQLMSWMLQ